MKQQTTTPEPWRVEMETISGFAVKLPPLYHILAGDVEIAATTNEANARVMAAAPRMLAVLKGLFEHCAMVHKHWGEGDNMREANAAIEAAQAVIAEVEGINEA